MVSGGTTRGGRTTGEGGEFFLPYTGTAAGGNMAAPIHIHAGHIAARAADGALEPGSR